MAELKRQSNLVTMLRKKGATTFKVKATLVGVPDLVAIVEGVTYWIEVKTLTDLSDEQVDFLLTTINSFVVYSEKAKFRIYRLVKRPFCKVSMEELEWTTIFKN